MDTTEKQESGRVKAFLVHLLLSAVIGTAVGAVFWFILYPAPLFRAVGGLDIFLVVLTVDVILGPVLTLIVFRKGKKRLWLDLAVIDESRVSLMRGVGDGSFAEGATIEFPAPVVELSLFDLNRDGRDDLVAGTFTGASQLTIALSGP